jgi:hypothetical protein
MLRLSKHYFGRKQILRISEHHLAPRRLLRLSKHHPARKRILQLTRHPPRTDTNPSTLEVSRVARKRSFDSRSIPPPKNKYFGKHHAAGGEFFDSRSINQPGNESFNSRGTTSHGDKSFDSRSILRRPVNDPSTLEASLRLSKHYLAWKQMLRLSKHRRPEPNVSTLEASKSPGNESFDSRRHHGVRNIPSTLEASRRPGAECFDARSIRVAQNEFLRLSKHRGRPETNPSTLEA